jgi:hypothetical protein
MKIAVALALLALGAKDSPTRPPPGMHQASPSDFDFAAAWESPCVPRRDRRGPNPAFTKACADWSKPQYFHGVWSVGFEESNFTFMGKMDCYRMRDHSCIELREKRCPGPQVIALVSLSWSSLAAGQGMRFTRLGVRPSRSRWTV